MFTFTDRYTFDAEVKVTFPGGAEQSFTATFLMPDDEKDIFEKIDAPDMPAMIDKVRERLAKFWIGWSGIKIEGGGELAYTAENRDRLLKQRPIRMAVDNALHDAIMGIREKN